MVSGNGTFIVSSSTCWLRLKKPLCLLRYLMMTTMATVMQHISATIITVTLIVTIPLIIDPFKLVLEWPDTKNKINYSHCDIIFISQFKKLQFLYYINDLFFSLFLTFCNIDNTKVSKFIKPIQFI